MDGWDYPTSLFYSLEVGLSVGFCAPVRIKPDHASSNTTVASHLLVTRRSLRIKREYSRCFICY
jgi:hypothetical protein